MMNTDIIEKIEVVKRAEAYLDELEFLIPDLEWHHYDHELVSAKEIVKLEMEFKDVFRNGGNLENEYVTNPELIPLLIARESLELICCYFHDLSGPGWGDMFIKCYLADQDIELNSRTVLAIEEELDSLVDSVLRELAEDAFDSTEAASYSISAFEISKESPEKIRDDGRVEIVNIPGFYGPSRVFPEVPTITLDTPRFRCVEAVDDLVNLAQSRIDEAFDDENEYRLVRSIECGTFSSVLVMEILAAIITGCGSWDSYQIDLEEAQYMVEDLKSVIDEDNKLRVETSRPSRTRGQRVRTTELRRLSDVETEFQQNFGELEKELFNIRNRAREIASSTTAREAIDSKFVKFLQNA